MFALNWISFHKKSTHMWTNGAESPLWALCAAGLSGICGLRLIKHAWLWAYLRVSVTNPLWNHLLNGGSVHLLWENDTFITWPSVCSLLFCSRTVTSTSTCAGPTTPTCLGPSTPKTPLQVSSWALVSGRRKSHFFCFCAYVDCLTLASPHSMINWCNLKLFKQEVASQCFLFNKGRKNRAAGYNEYE